MKKDEGENPHIVTNVFLRVGGMGLLSNSFCFSVFCRRNIHQTFIISEKDIKTPHLKGNQPWIFIGRTDAEAEAPIFWPPDTKSQLIGKDPDAGESWGQEKGMTEDEMVGWHHWISGHEFEQTPGVSEGQRSLVCCSPWGHKSQTWLSNSTTTTKGYTYSIVKKLNFCILCAYIMIIMSYPCKIPFNSSSINSADSSLISYHDFLNLQINPNLNLGEVLSLGPFVKLCIKISFF